MKDFIKYDKLISPITGYECKVITSQNIKQFGFDSIEKLHEYYPEFPLKCQSSIEKYNIASENQKKKKFIHPEDDIPQSDLFLDNDYTREYFSIIKEARDNNKDLTLYTELHHIIPRSMKGPDDWSNIVKLTPKQHFLCHYNLINMVERKSEFYYKILNAFNMMKAINSEQNRYFDSDIFEETRIEFSLMQSNKQQGSGNSQYGTTWITNWELKISKKIKKEDLDFYQKLGWINKRIMYFENYKMVDGKIKKLRNSKKNQK